MTIGWRWSPARPMPKGGTGILTTERNLTTMVRADSMGGPAAIAVIGTGTGVGKTAVAIALVTGLRGLGRRCWIHKPVACGGWDGSTAEDGRSLVALCADGQDPATICPRQYPEAASPHLAAGLAGDHPTLADLTRTSAALRGSHDLVVETAGGLLTPLTARRETVADLVCALGLTALVVTVPDLGTLNHTALTVSEARRRGIPIAGLVLVHVRPPDASVAVATAATELAALCGLPILAEIPHRPSADAPVDDVPRMLAAAVIARPLQASRA